MTRRPFLLPEGFLIVLEFPRKISENTLTGHDHFLQRFPFNLLFILSLDVKESEQFKTQLIKSRANKSNKLFIEILLFPYGTVTTAHVCFYFLFYVSNILTSRITSFEYNNSVSVNQFGKTLWNYYFMTALWVETRLFGIPFHFKLNLNLAFFPSLFSRDIEMLWGGRPI